MCILFSGDDTESVWKKDAKMPSFPPLNTDLKTDVLIVGGGLAGLLCAYKLKQEGIRCVLLEADRICTGITGNTTAKITSQHGLIYYRFLRKFGQEAAKAYWEIQEKALKEYWQLSEKIRCDFQIAPIRSTQWRT